MKKHLLFLLYCISFLSTQNVFARVNQEDYRYLDELALAAGADKASNYHNYTEIYARYFAPLKDKPIKFLEIGIYKGNSVRLWEEYFKNAELHFMDITLERVEYSPQRAHFHIADQEKPEDLRMFIQKTGGNFDVIVDDGGHTMMQQVMSFKYLFPQVKRGGMYIIEDLHTSYWTEYGGGDHPRTAINFLKGLIDDVNFVGAHTTRASHHNVNPALKDLNLYRAQIESIHFYDSVAIIIKR
ncbi:MAG TPA: class I SAM-dependent methyltransferase [Rhabdochlamydiaceae bacterium]